MIPLEANRKRAVVEPALGNLLPYRGLAQVARRLLRGHRVDVKGGAPFKTRRAGGLRHDLDVAVVGRGTWKPGGGQPAQKGHDRNTAAFPNDPALAPRQFLRDQVAVDAGALPGDVVLRRIHLLAGPFRHHGQGDQLRVWVRERRAGDPTVVAEEEQVLEALVAVQILVALV